MSTGEWCLIESDPGVFSELIRGFGVSGIQVDELYTLDDESFADLKPIHGLIFLFKVDNSLTTSTEHSVVSDSRLDEMFFAKQVINNACATQAILNLLLNVTGDNLSLGDTLGEFKEFTKSFDGQTAGLAITNSEHLRKVHNSFARQQVFELDDKLASTPEDQFHFVGYLPLNGRLYEFDGLKEGPIDHGTVDTGTPDGWLKRAKEVLQQRIDLYSGKEIRFNLMALITDKRMRYEAEIARLQELSNTNDEAMIELARVQSLLEEENAKLLRYKQDNLRRKHNYMPLIIGVLKNLAENGKLTEFYETAKKRSADLREASSSVAA